MIKGLLSLCLLASAAFGQTEYILKVAPADLSGVLSRHGLTLAHVLRDGSTGLYEVAPPPNSVPSSLTAEVLADDAVLSFEPDSDVAESEKKPAVVFQPNPQDLASALSSNFAINYYGAAVRSSYVNQAASGLIHLPGALDRFGSGNTIVAVIDTGVDPNHPALKDVLLPGYDFTRNLPGTASELADLSQSTVAILDQSTVAILDGKNTPVVLNQSTVAILDQSTVAILDASKLPGAFGHGTMTAGLVHLAAPTARIMPLKAFSADGSANLSDIIRAVYYAVDNGARVINMSFSMKSPSPELAAAIAYAAANRVILVASVGNDGREARVYPASNRSVIGVASTNNNDIRSLFSNHGDSAQTAAPGEAIITTYPGNNYAGVWGTSFSTALVSGAAALFLQVAPNASPGSIADALEHGKKIPGQDCGDARLDVLSSLVYLTMSHD